MDWEKVEWELETKPKIKFIIGISLLFGVPGLLFVLYLNGYQWAGTVMAAIFLPCMAIKLFVPVIQILNRKKK